MKPKRSRPTNALPEPPASVSLDPDPRPISFSDSDIPLIDRSALSVATMSPEQMQQRVDNLHRYIPRPDVNEPDRLPLHESRWYAWQLGLTYGEIAKAEDESLFGNALGIAAIDCRRSCFYFLLRLDLLQRLQAQSNHTLARAHLEHADSYFMELGKLLSNPNWMARSDALKHWRRTAGIEGAQPIITVNLDQRKQTVNINTSVASFEQAMTHIRAKHEAETEPEKLIEASVAVDAELVEEPL